MKWIPIWPLITVVLWAILPPSYERGYAQPRITFVTTFLSVFVSVFAIEFVFFLFAYIVLGGKPSEVQEHLEMLSEPMRWFSQQFLITPEKSFVDACGVMLGNSFLVAIPLMVKKLIFASKGGEFPRPKAHAASRS